MPDIINWISQYTEFFPLLAVALLLLASLSIPLSEDLIIITGALLCRGDPSMLVPTFLALYFGVAISDYIPYNMGKLIRKGTLKSNFFTRLFSQRKLDKMHHYLEKFGIFTFIVCRFIPFGVRNTLFMSSGFFGLRLRRFAVYDITAATISVSTLFFLVYHFGEAIEKPFHVVGKILFLLVLSAFVFISIRIIRRIILKTYSTKKLFGLRYTRMHIPLTKYGLPQVLVYPVLVLALMALLFVFLPKGNFLPMGIVLLASETLLFAVLVWMLMFFRNPHREIPFDEKTLLSPADGTITDISEVEDPDLGGKVLRIGMFLSIFNVHLNRMPCSARVEAVRYKEGRFINAMSAESGRINESNEILITRLAEPRDRLLVRQVSGAIARRIVCKAEPEREYAQGFAFGMIKFGSRTELYLPCAERSYDITVKIGDKVRAGLSPLIVYKP